MKINNCQDCGNIYEYKTTKGKRCPDCRKKVSDSAWSAYGKKWLEDNPSAKQELKTQRTNENRKIVQDIKIESGCMDCGYNFHPAALHFDHLEDKKLDVSQLVGQGYSLEVILKEIEKCEVVCANCHAVRTDERRKGDVS